MPKDNPHRNHRERLKQRFLQHGLESFEPHQVLELLLFYAIPRKDTNPIAHRLLKQFGSLAEVFRAPAAELAKVEGIGSHAAMLIKLQHSLFLRYNEVQCEKRLELSRHGTCVEFVKSKLQYLDQEEFHVTCVDSRLRLIKHLKLFRGSISSASVNLRILTAKVLETGASGVILSHNHPSGIAKPSEDDELLTETVMLVLRYQEVELLEHLIIAENSYYSFHAKGKISELRDSINKKIPKLFVAQTIGGFE